MQPRFGGGLVPSYIKMTAIGLEPVVDPVPGVADIHVPNDVVPAPAASAPAMIRFQF